MSFSIREHHRVVVAVFVVLGLLLALLPAQTVFAQQDTLACSLSQWLPLRINKSACADTIDSQANVSRILKDNLEAHQMRERLNAILDRLKLDLSSVWAQLRGIEKAGLPRLQAAPDSL